MNNATIKNSKVLERLKKEIKEEGVNLRASIGHDRYDRVHNRHNRGQ